MKVACILCMCRLYSKMSHSKGGSEIGSVNDDTIVAVGQPAQMHHSSASQLTPVFFFPSIPRLVNLLFMWLLNAKNWLDGLSPADVRECMSVAPPTEWACIEL